MTDKSKLNQLIEHKEMLDTKIGILKAERKVTEAQIVLEKRIGISNGTLTTESLALRQVSRMF